MALYRVTLRGENFLLNLNGEPQLLGFRVSHYVRADSEEEARRIAIITTRKNAHLQGRILNTPANPTRLDCEGVKRVWWRSARRDGCYSYWEMPA